MQQQAMQQQQQVMQQQQQALQQQQQQQAMQQQQALRQQQHTMSQQSSYTGSVGVSSGYHQAANTQPRSSGVNWMTLIVKWQCNKMCHLLFQRSFRAMYDYDADDDDEVSFRDGDVIVDCKPIDEGWMMGTVLRTGRSGMVPANYIEPIN